MNNEKENKEYISYSEIEKKDISFIWYPYIPKGMVILLSGDTKSGKTYMLADLIARITKGDKLPFSDDNFESGVVIFQNSEDSREHTLLPRLEQQGADTSKVYFINDEENVLTLKQHKRLESIIKELKPILCVIDPIQSFTADININSMSEVRQLLTPLKRIAQENNCTIILVQHLKKGNETKAIYKGVGSIDFVGFVRTVLSIMKDPNDKEIRLLVHTASNIAKIGNCLSFKISDNGVEWLEDKGEVDADELMNMEGEIINKFESAKTFIIGCLANGELSSKELSKYGKEIGKFAEKTFNVARAKLRDSGIIKNYEKDKKWYWCLTDTIEENSQVAKREGEDEEYER